jgi:hypothetical protein
MLKAARDIASVIKIDASPRRRPGRIQSIQDLGSRVLSGLPGQSLIRAVKKHESIYETEYESHIAETHRLPKPKIMSLGSRSGLSPKNLSGLNSIGFL